MNHAPYPAPPVTPNAPRPPRRHHRWTRALAVAMTLLLAAACVRGADAPDLTAPPLQTLRGEYLTQRADLAKQRAEALRQLLEERAATARQMAAKAKLSGNITATASGAAAVRLFSDAQENFARDGAYAITNVPRRDLEAMVAAYMTQARALDDKYAKTERELNANFAAKLGAALQQLRAPEPDREKLLALLEKLAGTAATNAAAATAANAPSSATTNAATTNAAPESAPTLATSGACSAWQPLARLEAETHDTVEIVAVSLQELTAPRTVDGVGAMGQPWRVVVTPERALIADDPPPPFRLVATPPLKPLDVLTWPSARNKWTLELRARADALPSRHGAIIETDAAATRALNGGGEAPPRVAGPPVKVGFASQPPGALVFADGKALSDEKRQALLTPFITTLPGGPTDLRFRKRGYQDAVLRQALMAESNVFRVALQPIAGFAEHTLTVKAGGPEWLATGLRVKKGVRVAIAATGQWACAAGGERVDADGYPNNDQFYRYYINPALSPRLSALANYGQLLARVAGGEPIAIGKQGAFTAAADGELELAINETPTARRDNKGELTVRVTIEP
jgi:hypothetical protein